MQTSKKLGLCCFNKNSGNNLFVKSTGKDKTHSTVTWYFIIIECAENIVPV